jgi:hypothetical protein
MMTDIDTGSDGLTAAEQAYFDSRGASTDGLASEAVTGSGAEGDAGTAGIPQSETNAALDHRTAAADPDEEPVGDDGRPRNPGRFIRFGAFDKERNRRKELERELTTEREGRAKEREAQARLTERLDLLNAALRPAADGGMADAQPAPPPDPEKDIFGYVRWQDQRLADLQHRLDETARHSQQRHQQTAAQLAESHLRSAYMNDAQRFAVASPDFLEAYQHLLRGRDEELAHVGVADAKQRAAMIAAEERDIVEASLRAGLSPAQRIYGLARLRGYAPAAVAGSPGSTAAAPSVSDEIARIKAGAGASKSLSQAGGTGGGLTLEALASMPQEEFDAWLAKASRAQVRAVMGG